MVPFLFMMLKALDWFRSFFPRTVFYLSARSLRPHVVSLQFPLPPIESVFLLCLPLFPSGLSFSFFADIVADFCLRGTIGPSYGPIMPAPDWSPARKGVPERDLRERRNGAGSGRAESRGYLDAAPYYFLKFSVEVLRNE